MELTKSTLRPGMLIANGRDLYTVSTLHDDHLTLRVDLESGTPPVRTTVRQVSYEEVRALFRPGTEADEKRAGKAYA